MGRVISIANQKGGVGKTTTAINLAASLAAAEKKTLLVDMDPQANATSGLGIRPEELGSNVYRVLISGEPMEKAILGTVLKYLDLVPSHVDLLGAEVELVGALSRETVLARAARGIRDRYDYILIDCPPSLGLLTLNALTAADTVLVPLQCEYYALEGLSKLLSTVRLVKGALNPDLVIEGILLTMFDARNNLSYQVAEEARRYFPDKVFRTVIHRNVRLSEAPGYGKPALIYDISSPGAQGYLDLARELLNGERS